MILFVQSFSRRLLLTLSLLAAVLVAGVSAAPPEGVSMGTTKDFAAMLERARDYTLKVAEAMPEGNYTFKPVPEVMSFGDQLEHIASSNLWFCSRATGQPFDEKSAVPAGKTKADLLAFTKKSFDQAITTLLALNAADAATVITLFGPVKMTKAQVFMSLRDHATHHRGNMITYLRLKGIKPPEYVAY